MGESKRSTVITRGKISSIYRSDNQWRSCESVTQTAGKIEKDREIYCLKHRISLSNAGYMSKLVQHAHMLNKIL